MPNKTYDFVIQYNQEKAFTRINTNNLKEEIITDTLINNLTKYHLNDIKEKVLKIKNPPRKKNISDLTEDEILSMAFDSEL